MPLLLFSCGDGAEEAEKKRKARQDSVRMADSVERLKKVKEAMKKAEEDSVMAAREYEMQLHTYDSLRETDSLRVKHKKHPPVKPAPKRELGGKSPVK